MHGTGEGLSLNLGVCDGPSSLRHERCGDCSETRNNIAREIHSKTTNKKKEKWTRVFLCRIHVQYGSSTASLLKGVCQKTEISPLCSERLVRGTVGRGNE